MTSVKDEARKISVAVGAAVLGLAGASVSALAADGDNPPACTDPAVTSPDPTVTTPCPTDPAPTTPTSTTATPAAPTPPASPPAPAAPPSAPQPAAAPVAPASAPAPPAPTQHRRPTRTTRAVRTTAVPRHRAGTNASAPHATHHRHHRRRDRAADGGLGRGRTLFLPSHMPDPTPPSARVDAGFMRMLRATAHHAGVDWALVLAVLRAKGHDESRPAKAATVRALAHELRAHGAGLARAAAATTGSSEQSDRAVALARYYRGVGPRALVEGLASAKPLLIDRVMHRPGIDIYPGGQVDVMSGRVDVRVLAAILYLRQTFHQVTVSCLITGHRLFARPGVVSAHIYGLAADISALGGVPIAGHQQVGGVTDHAVQDLLRLPILPKQIISLLDLGGPSFALSNHWDHIHVGY